MKGSRGIDPLILKLGLMEVRGQRYALTALPQGKDSDTHWIGGCMSPRAVLDIWEKNNFCGTTEMQTPDRPAGSIL